MTAAGIWGTIPDWLQAVGTIGAVVVALWLASSERRAREWAAAEARAAKLGVDIHGRGDGKWRVVLSNPTSRAFTHIVIRFTEPSFAVIELARLGPGERSPDQIVGELNRTDKPECEIRYTDDAGRRWSNDLHCVRRVLPRRLLVRRRESLV